MIRYLRILSDDDMDYTGEMDRIFTKLVLDDYDWVNYRMEAIFPMKDAPVLLVKLEYCGSMFGTLTISTFYDSDGQDIEIRFNSEIFEKYLSEYLESHLLSRDNPGAFYGGDIILKFWNEVMLSDDTTIRSADTTGCFEKLNIGVSGQQ